MGSCLCLLYPVTYGLHRKNIFTATKLSVSLKILCLHRFCSRFVRYAVREVGAVFDGLLTEIVRASLAVASSSKWWAASPCSCGGLPEQFDCAESCGVPAVPFHRQGGARPRGDFQPFTLRRTQRRFRRFSSSTDVPAKSCRRS